MHVRVVTLRYSDGVQGFPEDALRSVTAGREVLEVREHFFVHGTVPHMALVLLLGDGAGAARPATGRSEDNPELDLAEGLRPLYRDLRRWRNDEAKKAGLPPYTILRNAQLAEVCRRLPRSLAGLREIEGVGEATCARYGAAILALLPKEPPATQEEAPR